MKNAQRANFRSAEYLDGLFKLAEGLVLDQQDKQAMGARYREAWQLSGLTQLELGNRLNLSDRAVRSYCDAAVENMAGMARAWARETGVRYTWLVTGEGPMLAADEADRLPRIEELLEDLLVEVRAWRAERPEGGAAPEATG